MMPMFLACALALPSPRFCEKTVVDRVQIQDEVRKVREIVNRIAPASEMTIAPPGTKLPGWERFIITWRGNWIYIRRPAVHDRKVSA